MQFEIYQWIVPLIGLFFISRTVYNYLQNKRSVVGMIVWITFWTGIIILAAIPNLIAIKMAEIFGFRDVSNAIIFGAIGLLLIIVFYMSATIERLENKITSLVRNIALNEVEKSKLIEEIRAQVMEDIKKSSDKNKDSLKSK